ncbi:hypothetical protein NRB20_59600 [Nocardia sp. RB20]|uniref:Uncharacterized protein n=1 Tax=Nocardia macrotermitis TaxID=2585198 RepID=A0A7K0DAT5_9NOCA|nr:hypothetical protein [Nocardia macrotermitis]
MLGGEYARGQSVDRVVGEDGDLDLGDHFAGVLFVVDEVDRRTADGGLGIENGLVNMGAEHAGATEER